MRSYAFDLEANWTSYTPFLLSKLGVYQGWVNADVILDQNKFVTSRYDYKPLGTVADVLKDLTTRAIPVAPALIFDKNKLDGTCTPSAHSTEEGKAWKIRQLGNNFAQNFQNENVENLKNFPFSPLNAPNMGEANNLTPTMYMEPDPQHISEYAAVVYVCQESFHNNCVQRAQNTRHTRFETKNDPAWTYHTVTRGNKQ